MDADVTALQRFADVPYAIVAPVAQGGVVGPAARALAKGARIRWDDTGGVTPGRYRAMVEGIRKSLEADLASRDGYDVNVLDVSAPDAAAELAGIHDGLRGQATHVGAMSDRRGAFSAIFRTTDGSAHCIAVGYRPDLDVDAYLASGSTLRRVPRVGLDDSTFHRLAILHETGHCLLGTSEAKADAFAALMALRDPAFRKDALALWASWREREEWTLPDTDEDHFTAKSVWAVLERADALRSDPAFGDMDAEAIAGLANAIVDDRGLSQPEEDHVASVRRAMRAGVRAVSRGEPGDSFEPLLGWLRRHRDIPENARILDVRDNIARGARPLESFVAEPGGFRTSIAALARDGDRVAAAMLRAYDAAPAAHGHSHASGDHGHEASPAIPYRFARTAYQSRVTAYMATDGAQLPSLSVVSARAGDPVEATTHDEPEPAPPGSM